MKIALFPGSFDPFTLGHKSIVDRTLATIADRVTIAIGVNYNKRYAQTIEERIAEIKRVYANDDRVEVVAYEGLTTDFAQTIGASFIVRGIRSIKDFEYERDIAELNRRLTGIETVLLITETGLSHISSTVVRELQSYGKDVSEFLP